MQISLTSNRSPLRSISSGPHHLWQVVRSTLHWPMSLLRRCGFELNDLKREACSPKGSKGYQKKFISFSARFWMLLERFTVFGASPTWRKPTHLCCNMNSCEAISLLSMSYIKLYNVISYYYTVPLQCSISFPKCFQREVSLSQTILRNWHLDARLQSQVSSIWLVLSSWHCWW